MEGCKGKKRERERERGSEGKVILSVQSFIVEVSRCHKINI